MRQNLCWLGVWVCLLTAQAAAADAYFDKYPISAEARQIDLGVQPMAYPLAFLSSVMQRDRLLRAELTRLGTSLRLHPFRKGNDMVALMGGGRLEGALLGDMPTINSAVRAPLAIVGLGKRNFSSLVATQYSRIEQLRGKKIGYSPGSSSHHVLLQGLTGSHLKASDVTLVVLEPSAMPGALARGEVDAFSAWEPTPSIALAMNPKNRAIYRGMSTDWFVLTQDLVSKQPEAALAIVASYARAIVWMRKSSANVAQAASWVLADGQAFLGTTPAVTHEQAVRIVRSDLLMVAGAPAVPKLIDGALPLGREFAFLKAQGLLAPEISETKLRSAFAYEGLKQVLLDAKRFDLHRADYDK